MVLVYRWSFCTGVPCIQVILVYRWSFYTGGPFIHDGPFIQMVLVYRWSLYIGGPCIQVVLVYRCSLYTGGPCIQVVLVYRWSLYIFKREDNWVVRGEGKLPPVPPPRNPGNTLYVASIMNVHLQFGYCLGSVGFALQNSVKLFVYMYNCTKVNLRNN